MNQPTTTIATHKATRQNRIPYNYHDSYIPTNSLNALERYALNKSYNRESNIHRLERLEELAFGSIQSGDYITRFQNVEDAILSRPQQSYKRSFLGNLANYFMGQSTGFTPSLIPGYTPYSVGNSAINNFITPPNNFFAPNDYGNTNYETYSNGIFGRGYGIRNNSFNSGGGIRILD